MLFLGYNPQFAQIKFSIKKKKKGIIWVKDTNLKGLHMVQVHLSGILKKMKLQGYSGFQCL